MLSPMKEFDLEKYSGLTTQKLYKKYGKVVNVVGLTIESNGPEARLGDICYIYQDLHSGSGIMAEVVGFKDEKVILMPYYTTYRGLCQPFYVKSTRKIGEKRQKRYLFDKIGLKLRVQSQKIRSQKNGQRRQDYGKKR